LPEFKLASNGLSADYISTPHGGGGPGSGPVASKEILKPSLPTPVVTTRAYGRLGLDYNQLQRLSPATP